METKIITFIPYKVGKAVKHPIVHGNLIVDDEAYQCISGGAGQPMPHGNYLVKFHRLDFSEKEAPKYTRNWKPYYFYLEPLFETERTGLLIHPLRSFFTEGCIGVLEEDEKLYNHLAGFEGIYKTILTVL